MPHDILCVSFDNLVGNSRCAALTAAGYSVTGTSLLEYALQLLECEKCDLVIVGHRFPKRDKQEFVSLVKDKYGLPVVLVCGISADSDIPADGRVYALEGNEGLIRTVARLLPMAAAAAAGGT